MISHYHKSKGMSLFSLMFFVGMSSVAYIYFQDQNESSNGDDKQGMISQFVSGTLSQKAKLQIKMLSHTIELYMSDMGNYPSAEEGLEALVKKPDSVNSYWGGPYLQASKIPKDPWGYDYIYEVPGVHHDFDLYSLGNKKHGDSHDAVVANWDIK
ncbi:MAG: type II secretion system protein GspG [Gammaproteobacteria bacterium]|nr:type II secretion system protein GspG [Gammaproteobacteria bacterium]